MRPSKGREHGRFRALQVLWHGWHIKHTEEQATVGGRQKVEGSVDTGLLVDLESCDSPLLCAVMETLPQLGHCVSKALELRWKLVCTSLITFLGNIISSYNIYL